MGSKSSSSSTGPSKFAQPYITSGANAVQSAYTGNQANIANISQTLQSNMPAVVNSTLNNPGLAAAGTYNNNVLSGQYLNSNPYLQQQIDSTNSDVANAANAAIGLRGGAGGSAQAGIIARALAKNETALRSADYTQERGYQQQAATTAGSLSGAQDNNISSLLSYLTGQAQIPQSGANSYAQALAGLLGNSTTTTQSTPLLPSLLQAGAQAGSAAILASDRRLKEDVECIGELDDGLPVYEYRYVWGGERQRGVMADEVAQYRPWALGPRVGGYATVNYGAL